MKYFLPFFRVFGVLGTCLLFQFNISAQCSQNWQLSTNCGNIIASGGLGGQIEFCEGANLVFNNNTTTTPVDSVVIDWGDGTCERFAGNPPILNHTYDFPNDTCLQDDCGSIPITIRFGVIRHCQNNKISFHFITTPILIRLKPICDFTIYPNPACVNDEIDFNNNSCENSCTPEYKWTLPGNQMFTTEDVQNQTFPPGMHQIKLEVTNICGSCTSVKILDVLPQTIADATLDKYVICPGEIVTATNLSQNFASSGAFNWMVSGPSGGWMFVPPSNASTKDPKIRFTTPGTYTVKLTVSGCGNPVWDTTVVVMQAPVTFVNDTVPNGCIDPLLLNPGSFFTVDFADNNNVHWTFGPGATPATFDGLLPPSISFAGIGQKIICVNASGQCGNPMACDTFFIQDKSLAAFTIPATLCAPNVLLAPVNTSSNANSFTWTIMQNGVPVGSNLAQFTGGTNSQSKNPEITFSAEGDFEIKLSTGAAPCGSEVLQNITVRLAPTLTLAQVPVICTDTTFNPLQLATFGGGTPDQISWTFLNANPSSGNSQDPGPITFAGLQTFTITAVSQNFCDTVTAATTFDIISIAQINLDSIGPFCNGDPCITLSGMPNGGVWSGPGVSGNQFCPGMVPPANWNVPFILTYSLGTPATSCFASATLPVTVFGTQVTAGARDTSCVEDGVLVLSGGFPVGGVWSGDGIIDPVAGLFHPDSVAGPGPLYLVTYTYVDSHNCTNKADKEIVVSKPPDISGSLSSICIGVNLPLDSVSVSGGSICHWDFGDMTSADICNPVKSYTTEGTYQITLQVTSPEGCNASLSFPIDVVAPPDALMTPAVLEGCAVLTVNFQNGSSLNKYTTHEWNFGNNIRDTTDWQNPHPISTDYDPVEFDSVYTAVLSSKNGCGIALDTAKITVHPRPIARFGAWRSVICSSDTVSFNNYSGGQPDSYQWYVQNTLVWTEEQLPPQKFITGLLDSVYVIKLIVLNECGTDTLTDSVLVRPNPVKAFFNLPVATICQHETLQLTDLSTNGLNITWDFGDGETAAGDTVRHRFDQPGNFKILLFANNGCGYDTTFQWLTVHPSPVAIFSSDPSVCRFDTISFLNNSVNIAGAHWFFGDSSTDFTHLSPVHVYQSAGEFTVTLIVFSQTFLCPDTTNAIILVRELPVPGMAIPDSSGCQPFNFQATGTTPGNNNTYVWDFGDGTTGVNSPVNHLYTGVGQFNLRVWVTDDFGCKADTSFFPVTVHPKPVNDFSVEQTNLCETPAHIIFENKSIYADAYQWNFSNGQTSNLVAPEMDIAVGGNLTVTLYSESQFGCRDTLDKTITIYTRPQAGFDLSNKLGCAPFYAIFQNNSLNVNTWHWDFGDGGISGDSMPAHLYHNPGTYTVRLLVSADSVCFDSLEKVSFVQVLPSPTAAFSALPETNTSIAPVVPNGIYNFTDMSSPDVNEWTWDFGDGLGFSSEQNPTWRYDSTGLKKVQLIVVNVLNCLDTAVLEIDPEFFGGLFIPNAFTPGSGTDGERFFLPAGTNLSEYRLQIFSSNGQLVFHTTELEHGHPKEPWDGIFHNEPLPQGVYFWKVDAKFNNNRSWDGMRYHDGDQPIKEGKVLLLR